MWQQLLKDLTNGDVRALARSISLVENEADQYQDFLQQLPDNNEAKIIGITGPPGAGKSTLTDALIGTLVSENKKVAVLCVDPSSAFNLGAVLGDRIRMSDWYTHSSVFIRSLATRGAMGGLNPKTIEITSLLKAAGYDYIIVETVGVGQNEIEIVGLADVTVVVLVPEAGDEVQTMKAGLMEIADIFVVNKSDRPDADAFIKNLRLMLAPAFHVHENEVAIIKTSALQKTGVAELKDKIIAYLKAHTISEKRFWLLAEKAYQLIQKEKMKDFSKEVLLQKIKGQVEQDSFNMYKFVFSQLYERGM